MAHIVLPNLGAQLSPPAYILPATVGLFFGYIIGYLTVQQLILVQKLKFEIQERTKGEAWYSALFEKNHSKILLINPQTFQIMDANPTACEFYGYTRKQLKEMTICEINSTFS